VRLEFFGMEENRFECFESLGGQQVVESQGDRARGQVGVIRADDDFVDV